MSTLEVISLSVGIVATIIGGVYFVFAKIFKLGKTAKTIENIEQSIKDINNRIDNVEQKLTKRVENLPCTIHHDDLIKIKSVVIEKFPKSSTLFAMKASPKKLNPLGEKIFAEIDGEMFINANKKILFNYIDEAKPMTALDVEELSVAACKSLTQTSAFNDLKNYVYNRPILEVAGKTHEVSIDDICFILGLRIRDFYLEEHPGLIPNN